MRGSSKEVSKDDGSNVVDWNGSYYTKRKYKASPWVRPLKGKGKGKDTGA